MRLKKQILFFLILLLGYILYSGQFSYLETTILFDIFVVLIFINFLSNKNKFLFPSSLFIFIFYIYSVFGKMIWVYREFNWFNESGNPDKVASYFSLIGLILTVNSAYSIRRNFKINIFASNSLFFSVSTYKLLLLTFFTFVGAFLFTNQFKNIALFSDDIDAARVLTSKQSEGGRGIGFMFLTFGIIANSLILVHQNNYGFKRNIYFNIFFLINTLLLALYSGRFLPVIPIVIFLFIIIQGRTPNFFRVLKIAFIVLSSFCLLMYFGARRAFGANADFELIFRFLIADTFPEFRMTVYANDLASVNLFDNFFLTIITGLIPGPFFSIVGLNKFDYFRPIGVEILNFTQFDPAAVPGIRTSLFGELYFTGIFIPIFLFILLFLLSYLDKQFYRQPLMNFKKFRILSGSIFLCFSIPYGSLFFVSCTHFFLILYISEKFIFKNRYIERRPTQTN